MATKQELEAKVVELQSKIDELTSSLNTNNSMILSTSNEKKLLEDIEKHAEIEKQLMNKNDELNLLVSSLMKEVEQLKSKPSQTVSQTGNSVVLDGESWDIVDRDRMWECVVKWKKRFIDDNDTCLIVRKL